MRVYVCLSVLAIVLLGTYMCEAQTDKWLSSLRESYATLKKTVADLKAKGNRSPQVMELMEAEIELGQLLGQLAKAGDDIGSQGDLLGKLIDSRNRIEEMLHQLFPMDDSLPGPLGRGKRQIDRESSSGAITSSALVTVFIRKWHSGELAALNSISAYWSRWTGINHAYGPAYRNKICGKKHDLVHNFNQFLGKLIAIYIKGINTVTFYCWVYEVQPFLDALIKMLIEWQRCILKLCNYCKDSSPVWCGFNSWMCNWTAEYINKMKRIQLAFKEWVWAIKDCINSHPIYNKKQKKKLCKWFAKMLKSGKKCLCEDVKCFGEIVTCLLKGMINEKYKKFRACPAVATSG